MPRFRATFRYGAPRVLYEVLDLESEDLRSAMRAAAAEVTDEVAATAELVEIRVLTPVDEREYGPE